MLSKAYQNNYYVKARLLGESTKMQFLQFLGMTTKVIWNVTYSALKITSTFEASQYDIWGFLKIREKSWIVKSRNY